MSDYFYSLEYILLSFKYSEGTYQEDMYDGLMMDLLSDENNQ